MIKTEEDIINTSFVLKGVYILDNVDAELNRQLSPNWGHKSNWGSSRSSTQL
jgi:hypothetical protein